MVKAWDEATHTHARDGEGLGMRLHTHTHTRDGEGMGMRLQTHIPEMAKAWE